MRKKFTLKELGARLGMVDRHIVALLEQRMKLAKEVEITKRASGDPLLRFVVEEERLAAARARADTEGLDHNFVHAIFYMIIAEACRVQINQLQTKPVLEELCPERLKENLEALTRQIASCYDEIYGQNYFATLAYLRFEKKILDREIETLKALNSTGLALDLGCATGKIAFRLAESFEKVMGFDISSSMVDTAWAKQLDAGEKFGNIEFRIADIEDRLPVADNSVSLVVMNFGTASDVLNIRRVLAGIKRVLKPDGRFILSFYNAASLLCNCWFLPWEVSLAARVNSTEHCLDTRFGGNVYSIPARPCTVREVKLLLTQNGLLNQASQILTYPTVSSILPKEFFEEEGMQKLIEEIDLQLIKSDTGAYILVTGRKSA